MNLSVVFSNSICSSAGTILCWYDGPSTCKRLQFAIDSMVIEIVDLPIDSMVIFHRFCIYVYQRVCFDLAPNHSLLTTGWWFRGKKPSGFLLLKAAGFPRKEKHTRRYLLWRCEIDLSYVIDHDIYIYIHIYIYVCYISYIYIYHLWIYHLQSIIYPLVNQQSYRKWSFIVDFPIQQYDFPVRKSVNAHLR